MQIPIRNATQNNKINAAAFYGFNRTDKGQNGEFKDMVNMSSDHYPCLSPRKPRKSVINDISNIRAVIAPKYCDTEEITTFTGVAGTSFYYNDDVKPFEDTAMKIPENGNVTLVDFNGFIIICVYRDDDNNCMYYYNYAAKDDGKVHRMEKTVTGTTFTAGTKGDPETDAEVQNWIAHKDKNFKWTDYFDIGASICFSGFTNDRNNTTEIDSRFEKADATRPISCIVEKIEGNILYFQMYNYAHTRLVLTKDSGTVSIGDDGLTINTRIPVMNHVCIHNNRLWGTNPSGEYIYASKLGDCFNFNCFMGLANDSYYAEIGTKGDFVGIVSYRDNLVAFKRDYIHHIYGDKSSNYTIPKQLADCGCIDIRSAVEIGAVLYFLGYNGFYEYTGGQPAIISTALNAQYKSAIGMSDGVKYYVSAVRRDNGKTELLVYDTRYRLWHKEDEFDAIGYFRWHNDLYMASDSEVYRCNNGDEAVEWYADSVNLYENIFDDKGVNEIWIRAKIEEGSSVTVFTRVNGGEWSEHNTLLPQGLKVYRVPVRFKKDEYFNYKLEGIGAAVIYDIEYIAYIGGRPYKITI